LLDGVEQIPLLWKVQVELAESLEIRSRESAAKTFEEVLG
jgi:hypothetical protein